MPLFRLYIGDYLTYRPRLKRVDYTSTVVTPESAYVTFEFDDREDAMVAYDVALTALGMVGGAYREPELLLVVVDGDEEVLLMKG